MNEGGSMNNRHGGSMNDQGGTAASDPRHDRLLLAHGEGRAQVDQPDGVVEMEHVYARDDYVAGDAKARANDLVAMFSDPEIDVVQALQEWKKAMTDSQGTVTNAFASGTLVAQEITWQGTHNGAFSGPSGTIPASGKHQITPAAMVVKFQGNKVKEINHYFDMVTFLTQIGAMPAATAGRR